MFREIIHQGTPTFAKATVGGASFSKVIYKNKKRYESSKRRLSAGANESSRCVGGLAWLLVKIIHIKKRPVRRSALHEGGRRTLKNSLVDLTMYYVYIIRSISQSEQVYVGKTTNLQKRISNQNTGTTYHTAKYNPCVNFYVWVKVLITRSIAVL